MIRERTKPAVWVVYDNIGYWVSDFADLYALGGWSSVYTIPDQPSAPFRRCPADGTLLRERTQAPVWVVYECTRYWVSDSYELDLLGGGSQVRVVPDRSITQDPPAYFSPVNSAPRDGARLRERTSSTPYIIVGGAKFMIDWGERRFFIYPGITVQEVPFRALTSAAPGFVPIPDMPRDGIAFRARLETTSYVVDGGRLYILANPNDCPDQIQIVPNGSFTPVISSLDPYRSMTCEGPLTPL